VICANCGAENRADRRFCLQCGSVLSQGCPNCGAANEPEARFCGNCGQALGAGQPAATGATGVKPARATTTAAGQQAATAERRLVTVLFADLVGFTPFAEERDAEEVRDTLQRYFDLARQVIERYGGTVEKFIGDAVMAVWGTPTAHEDDAERAVRAALDLVDAVKTLGPGIAARAGVLTGEAAVNLGATDQGLLAGDLVNTAARLQSVAPSGSVLVGESTMRAAEAALAFEPAGEQSLKGKQAPIAAWRALRVIAQRRGQGRATALETPFVGRHEEFRLLREQLHLGARDPRARLVSITGPAGIGKSRLAWELEKYIDGVVEPIYWHRGRCPAYGEGVAFWALGEMVRHRARLAETDDEQTTRQGLASAVDDYVSDAGERPWILSSLLALLGLDPNPQGGREMLFAAWRRFFESIAERGTTVLVIEDLHWADSGLLDFIDHILDWSKSVPLLVVTLARPEIFDRRPTWGAGKRHFTALALEPLPPADMTELLTAIVPDLQPAAVRAIVERADGIPLYAVETVRMLIADGRLEMVDDACRPIGELGQISVPDTLRSLITSRLDDLDPADRALLQTAAVLGQSFTLDSLAGLGSFERDELESHLRQLVRRELLSLEGDPRSPERGQYTFMQSLTREVAYSTLPRQERRSRHLAAARHFESVGGDELAGVLAQHYVAAHAASTAGEETEAVAAQARIALRAAAERAAALGSHEQAAGYLEQALAVTDEPLERTALFERQAHEWDSAGRYERAEASARTVIGLYEAAGDAVAVARNRGLLGTTMIHAQRIPEAIVELEGALEQLPADAEPQARARALARLAHARYRNLELEPSLEAADQALVLAENNGELTITADALISRGTALSFLRRNQESAALLRAGVDLARREGDIKTAIRGLANLSISVARVGTNAEAVEVARQGLELARATGDLGMTIWMLGNVAGGSMYGGQPLEGLLAELDAVLTLELDPADRYAVRERALFLAIFRGRDVEAEVADWLRETEATRDPQSSINAHMIRRDWAMRNGSYAEASEYEEAYSKARADWAAPSRAALMAGMAGRAARMRELIDWAIQGPPMGSPAERGFRAAAHGAAAALDGRHDEAVAGFREALRLVRSRGDLFDAGLIGLAMLHFLGAEDPAAREAGEEALAIFERMGAEPMIDQLRAALDQPPPVQTATESTEVTAQPAG